MHCRVRIGAPSKREAYKISKILVKKKLVAGTMIYKGDCHYWWDNKIVEKEYWNIGAFSLTEHKDNIIKEVKIIHSDKCPITSFNDIDGNAEFLKWIKESVS